MPHFLPYVPPRLLIRFRVSNLSIWESQSLLFCYQLYWLVKKRCKRLSILCSANFEYIYKLDILLIADRRSVKSFKWSVIYINSRLTRLAHQVVAKLEFFAVARKFTNFLDTKPLQRIWDCLSNYKDCLLLTKHTEYRY